MKAGRESPTLILKDPQSERSSIFHQRRRFSDGPRISRRYRTLSPGLPSYCRRTEQPRLATELVAAAHCWVHVL